MAKDDFWNTDLPADADTPAESGGDFWLSDQRTGMQALPEGVQPSTAGAGRGSLSLSDYAKKTEALTSPPERTAMGTLRDIGVTAVRGAVALPQAVAGMADLAEAATPAYIVRTLRRAIETGEFKPADLGTYTKALEDAGIRFEDAQKILQDQFSPAQKAASGRVESAEGFVDTAKAMVMNPSVPLVSIGESLPQMGGGAVVARGLMGIAPKVAPWAAGGIGEGALGAGSSAAAIREKSDTDTITAKQGAAAFGSGIGTAAFGAAGGRLAQRLGVPDVDTMLASGKLTGNPVGFVKAVIGSGISEGVFEEMPQSAQEQMWQNWATNRPIMEGVSEAAAQGLVTGAAMGAGAGGASAAAGALRKPVDRKPQIERLRKAGDETAATLLEQRQQKEQATYTADKEAQALEQFFPEIAQRYREVRMTGAKSGDAVVQTAARWNFEQAAQLAGLSPKAQEAIAAKLAEVPPEKAPAFVQKAIAGLVTAGQAQPFDGMDTIAQTIEAQRDQMLDTVLSTMDDIEALESQDATQEATAATAQAVDTAAAAPDAAGGTGVLGADQPGALDSLSTEWQQFPEQTGTLNVPRSEMPQVKTVHRGPMVNFLNARGVTHEQVEVDPAELKPTQAEFSQTKVQEAADRDTDRSILISSDGHIIDGHHQAIAKLQNGKPVRAIRLNATAQDLIPLVREFPSSTVEQTADVQDLPQGAGQAGQDAQAQAVEAPAPARGDDAAAAGVPAAGDTAVMENDGVTSRDVMPAGLTLEVGGQLYPVESLAEASAMFSTATQRFTQAKIKGKASGFVDDAPIRDGAGRIVGYVGRGGSVFEGPNAGPGAKKLYDAGAAMAQPVADAQEAPRQALPKPAAPDAAPASQPNLNTSAEPAQKTAKTAQITQNSETTLELLGQNSQPLSEGGKPFKTEAAAKKEKKLHPTMRVAKAPGGKGFILKPATAKQIAAWQKAARRIKGADTGEKGPQTLHGFILSRGGLSRDSMQDAGFDKNERIGNRWLFSDTGETLAKMAEAATEAGFIKEETENALSEALRRSLRVSPVYTEEGYEAAAQAQAQAQFEDYLAVQQEAIDEDSPDFDPFAPNQSLMDDGYTEADMVGTGFVDASPELKAEVAALSAQLEAIGQDSESIVERVAMQYPTATQQEYHEQLKAAITAAIAEATQPAGRGDSGKDDGEQGQARSEGIGESLTLESRPDGTLAVTGDAATIKDRLTAAGIPARSILKSKTGVVVGKTQADRARNVLEGRDAKKATPTTNDLNRARQLQTQPASEPISQADIELLGRVVDAKRAEVKQRLEAGETFDAIPLGFQGDGDITAVLTGGLRIAGIQGKRTRETLIRALSDAPAETPTLTAPTKADIEAQQARTEQAAKDKAAADKAAAAREAKDRERADVKRLSEAAADSFELGGDPMANLTGQKDIFGASETEPTPAPVDDAKKKAADDIKDALGDLGDIFGKNFRMNVAPEQEQKLLPVLSRVMDAAFRLGYLKFKDAAKFALDKIREALGSEVADAITIDHLQGSYIAMAGKYKDQGADTKKAVVSVEDKAEIEAHTARADNPDTQENRDAASPNERVERDSRESATEPAMGNAVQGNTGDTAGNAGQDGGQADSGQGSGQPRLTRVQADGTPADRKRSRQRVSDRVGQAGIAEFDAGTDISERGADTGVEGVSTVAVPASEVADAAVRGDEDLKARAKQREADKTPIKTGDIENIRATLPYLLEGQQDDVLKTEQRFAVPDGYGMLFTNGTGTGKTFTGLGVVKRFARQGKNNTLIVVPDDKIAADWIDSARALGMTVARLESTKDAGRGISITTYANLGDNDALATRQWDLVVADEAHSLMQSADGKMTGYLENLRAITYHPDGAFQRYTMLNRPDIDRLDIISEQIEANTKQLNNPDTMDAAMTALRDENEKLQAQADKLAKKLREAREAIRDEVQARQGSKRTRAVFLSATPFAYEKTIDWANGYLFDYNEGREAEGNRTRSYNEGSNREQFFMQHFGYTMRYNKLNEPDGRKVDRGLMQRQFNSMLKKRGSLSGRMLDVKADYDRRFVLVESAVGNQIDEAIEWIEGRRKAHYETHKDVKGNDAPPNGYAFLQDELNAELYGPQGHLLRRYLLEAIKAKEVIPLVKQHMAMGRKLVVFHDFKKGGAVNPFKFQTRNEASIEGIEDPQEREEARQKVRALNQAVAEFNRKFPDLAGDNLLADLKSPITRFTQEIPGVLLINGDEKKSDLLQRYKAFNDDANGPTVALVQSAKNKGWSGHDTTGKHQRVLFNLGLPTQPTLSIQQEGRIYRTGQVSDAMFRYLNTGTNWERWAFAQTIAERASAAENLGMGELSRALKDSFISAFEESDAYPPGHEGEGKGGKERDKAANNTMSEWDRAKSFYWGTQKKNSKTKAQEGTDYFATPEPVGLKMVHWLRLRGGEDSMEPSGGHGAIARWLPDTGKRTVIEPSSALRSRLAMVMNPAEDRILDGQFEDLDIVNKFDGIAMNPPFGSGGKTAVEHVAKAATHLRDGGRIVALIPTGPAADKKFDKWFYETEQRPIKPAMKHPKLGDIYVGDTLTTNAAWAQKGVVMSATDRVVTLKVEGLRSGTGVTIEAVTAVEPTGKRTREVRPADGLYLVADIKLPQVTFERAGTSVATRIVVIEKQTDKARAPTQSNSTDLSDITDINELFDRIENVEMPTRAMTKAQEEAAKVEEAAPPARASRTPAARAEKPAKAEVTPTVDRQGAEIVEHTTAKGKTIRGIIRKDLTKEQAQEIDPYTWKKDGGFFIREKYLKPDDNAPAFSRQPVDAELFRRMTAPIQRGMRPADIQATIAPVLKRWTNGPQVTVVATTRDLPMSAPSDVHGVYSGGRVYLVAENIRDKAQAMRVLGHESIAHYGLREMLGKDDWRKFMSNVQLALKTGNKPLNAIREQVRRDYVDDKGRFNLTENQEADEIAAKVVEQAIDGEGNFKPGFGFVKSVYAKIAEFLRSMGIDVKMTHAELQGAIVNAQRFLEAGKRTEGAKKTTAPMFNRPEQAQGTPLDRAVMDMAGEQRDADEILGLIAQQSKSPFNRQIARLLRKTKANPAVSVGTSMGGSAGFKFIAKYSRKNHEVTLSELAADKAEQVFLHETVHAATLLALDKGGLIATQMNRLYESVKAQGGASGQYGMKNVGEFVAEAFTNKEFQKALKGMQAPGGSIWQRFVNIVRRILGMESNQQDALSKALELGVGVMQENMPLRAARSFRAEDAPAFAGIDQTETPAFKNWFGDSVVTENGKAGGKPLVVYHGTSADFNSFDPDSYGTNFTGDYGVGFYFTQNPKDASRYADNAQGDGAGANVVPVFLSLKNPKIVKAAFGDGDLWASVPGAKTREELTAGLKAQGYDGVIVNAGRTGSFYIKEAVAFRPEQIKSATGNRGTFDPDNSDIRFSRAAKTATAPMSEAPRAAQAEMFQPGFWDMPQPTRLDNAIFEIQDGRIDLKRVQEAISKASVIPEKFDARLKETLYPGRVATRSDKFLQDEAKPLLEAMARNNVTMDELADFLHARHAEERNKQIAKVNPDLPDGGAGKNSKGLLLTTANAKAYITGLSDGKRMVLEAMAKRVDAITEGTRKLLVDEGLEKQETMDAWMGAYKSYVPLFREEAENGNPHPTGSGMSVRGSASKRATGSTKKATNILAHVLMQREAAITRAEKNRVAVALYGLALSNPNPDFWTTIKPSMTPKAIGQELQRMGVDPTVAEAGMQGVPTIKTVDPVLGRVVSRPNPLYKSLPGAIVLKVKGEDRVLMINTNDPRGLRMAENLKNLDGLTKLDIAGSVVGKATRWMASVNTQYNPAFGLVNLTRDTLGGAINLSSTKLRGKTLKVLALTPGALKGIGLELSGAKSGEWGKLFRQFQADGGQTGYREMFKDANERAKNLQAELKRLESAGQLTPGKVADSILNGLDIFNTTLENAVRLAAYREALLEGMSRPEAARLARELTVDFNRKGRLGRELGPLYAFFNASTQGAARTLQTLAGPAGAKIIAGGVALGVLQAMMLLAAGYEEDEIPEFVKARAFIIPLGRDEEGNKKHLTIPLPLGLHVLPNTGRVLTELTLDGGKETGAKAFAAVGEIAGAFNPLGGGNIFTADGALRTVAPTVVDPFIEVLSNKNFAGTPIERERYENDPRPGFERVREGTLRTATGQAYTEISRIINTATGGNAYEAGLASPSPEMVRYLAQVVGGGLLREVEKTINTTVALARDEETKPTGFPVFGRFYGETDDESTQRTRFYDNLRAIEKAEKMVKAAEKKGDSEAAMRIEDEKPESMLGREKNRALRDLRELNKEAMETVGDRETIKAIDKERTEVMRDLNLSAREIDAPRREATPGEKVRRSLGLANVNP